MSTNEHLSSAEVLFDEAALDELKDLETEGEPSIICQLVEMYVEDVPVRVAALKQAIASQDATALRESAHLLKGASRQLGLVKVVADCQELESQGKAQQLSESGDTLRRLEASLTETVAALVQRYPAEEAGA